jgi:hypothetical protein
MSAGQKPAKNPLKYYARYVNKLQMWCGYYKSAFKVRFGMSHIFFLKARLKNVWFKEVSSKLLPIVQRYRFGVATTKVPSKYILVAAIFFLKS